MSGSILRIVESPPLGGDTLWADMGAAYDLHDEETRGKVDNLIGLHDFVRVFGSRVSLKYSSFGKTPSSSGL